MTCSPVVAALAASVEPSSSLTAIQDNSPSPGPTPAHVARNTAPALAKLTAAPTTIAGGPQRYCANAARAVTFSVRATDADTVANVVLSYREPGASGFATKPMTKAPGGDTWQATLRTDTDAISGSGALRYFVTATDANAAPLTARLPGSGSGSIAVADCTNSGPTLASLKASPGTVHTNPGACQSGATTTTVSVNATDVDTVDRGDAVLQAAWRRQLSPEVDGEERVDVERQGDPGGPEAERRRQGLVLRPVAGQDRQVREDGHEDVHGRPLQLPGATSAR